MTTASNETSSDLIAQLYRESANGSTGIYMDC